MKLVVKKYDELTAPELYEIMRARAEIFVVEQDCVYQDCDDCDYEYHVFLQETPEDLNCSEENDPGDSEAVCGSACDKEAEPVAPEEIIAPKPINNPGSGTGRVLAYLRLYTIAEKPLTAQMGRVLTINHGHGLGAKVLDEGIKVARDIMKVDKIFIEAETYVIGYYKKAGFVQTSEEFLKDDIPHVRMELNF